MTDQRRALLTEREREILTGDADVTSNYRYSVESRVRARLRDKLKDDIDVLREHYPEIYDRLVFPVVCEPEPIHEAPGEREEPTTVEPTPEPEPAAEIDRDALRGALAGSGDVLERRVDAIIAMYEYLREHGSAEKGELLDAVDIDATGYSGRASVWSNMVKGRDSLRALPGVEPPSSGMSTWRCTDE